MKTADELFKDLMELSLEERKLFKAKLNSDWNFYVSDEIPIIPMDAVGLPLYMCGTGSMAKAITAHAKAIPILRNPYESYDKIQRESNYGLWAKAAIEDSAFLRSIYLVGVLSSEDLEKWEFYDLPEDWPGRNFGFNIRRDKYGMPPVELEIGNTYVMKLGKNNPIFKKMELVNIMGSKHFPDLYFREIGGTGITNIGYHKIWCQIKRIENES